MTFVRILYATEKRECISVKARADLLSHGEKAEWFCLQISFLGKQLQCIMLIHYGDLRCQVSEPLRPLVTKANELTHIIAMAISKLLFIIIMYKNIRMSRLGLWNRSFCRYFSQVFLLYQKSNSFLWVLKHKASRIKGGYSYATSLMQATYVYTYVWRANLLLQSCRTTD